VDSVQNQTMTARTASKTSAIKPARNPASKYERLHVADVVYQCDEEVADGGPIGCVVIKCSRPARPTVSPQ
jgi:hypothetical protein